MQSVPTYNRNFVTGVLYHYELLLFRYIVKIIILEKKRKKKMKLQIHTNDTKHLFSVR